MKHHHSEFVTLKLERITVKTKPEELDYASCIRCESAADYLQPDPQDCSRLVYYCQNCRTWFLVEESPRRDKRNYLVMPGDLPKPVRARKGPKAGPISG